MENKFKKYKDKTLFDYVDSKNQFFIKNLFLKYNISFQEFRLICETAIDLNMWEEISFADLWNKLENQFFVSDKLDKKKQIFKKIIEEYERLKRCLKVYNNRNIKECFDKIHLHNSCDLEEINKNSDKKILGLCPVASDKTVCCLLKTLDVVQKCMFGCSYCSIDTFYDNEIVFEQNLKEKLKNIKLDSDKFYHIGTGQSSDALYWGNKNGMLDDLCQFAKDNPNILLEFKTKSDNVDYFIKNSVNLPSNIVCSWTLNTDTIIANEEFGTPCLDRRINAAKKCADKGIKIGFHFHPMVFYKNWEKEYADIAELLQQKFKPEQISFISLGAVTFIKPVIKNIRRKNKKGVKTKILQMPMTADPHGKLTYPDEIKVKQFAFLYNCFDSSWQAKKKFYLCMEKKEMWDLVFGQHYKSNEEFEKSFQNFISG